MPHKYVAQGVKQPSNNVVLVKNTPLNIMFYQVNELLTLNRHSTQSNWPHTLEWGCSVGRLVPESVRIFSVLHENFT